MTSRQRRKLLQQNGAKAAGAKSPEGIQKSSMNALRHGLLSKTLVLSTESQEKFDEHVQIYMDKFQPQDGVETNLVYEMIAAKWRQQRAWMVETTALELEMDDQQIDIDEHEANSGEKLNMTNPRRIALAVTKIANNEKTLELLLRYETSLSRMHDRAMKTLFRLREESKLRNDPKPAETEPSPAQVTPQISSPESQTAVTVIDSKPESPTDPGFTQPESALKLQQPAFLATNPEKTAPRDGTASSSGE